MGCKRLYKRALVGWQADAHTKNMEIVVICGKEKELRVVRCDQSLRPYSPEEFLDYYSPDLGDLQRRLGGEPRSVVDVGRLQKLEIRFPDIEGKESAWNYACLE